MGSSLPRVHFQMHAAALAEFMLLCHSFEFCGVRHYPQKVAQPAVDQDYSFTFNI